MQTTVFIDIIPAESYVLVCSRVYRITMPRGRRGEPSASTSLSRTIEDEDAELGPYITAIFRVNSMEFWARHIYNQDVKKCESEAK